MTDKTQEQLALDMKIYEAIIVWKSDRIPKELLEWIRLADIHLDDSDWVAIIPPLYKDEYIPWLEQPAFGCCDVKEHKLNSEGYRIVIGYHS